jgi:hypothetical protein
MLHFFVCAYCRLVSELDVRFTATLAFILTPVPSVSISMVMVNKWVGAFGIKQLTVDKLGAAVTLIPSPPFLKGFELEAGITLGPMKIAAAIGLDMSNPLKFYFYAEIKDLTMGNIIKIFKPTLNLPGFISNTGFVGSCEASFSINPDGAVSLTGREIPNGFKVHSDFFFFFFM